MADLDGHDTRAALVRSAQKLIAERGLGTVSIKDITRDAGARNPSAVHYHFGNVEELIKEVFAQRFATIELERIKRFEELSDQGAENPLQSLMEAALSPLFETCLDQEGRLYVRFCVQFVSDPRFDVAELAGETSLLSLRILAEKLAACLPHLPKGILAVRFRQGFHISMIQALDYAKVLESGTAPAFEKVLREAARSLSGFFSAPVP